MRLVRTVALLSTVFALLGTVALAQTPDTSSRTSQDERLFLSFIEDATVVSNQWWEGFVEYSDGNAVDVTELRGVAAFHPWPDLELGGRVGFGDTDTGSSMLDGSGATDLDLWGKYDLGARKGTEYAVGGIVTVPTGDDTAGLGFDAFGVSAFGTLRRDLERAIVSANVGFRFNGDGRVLGGPDIDGKTSPSVGFGVIFPLSDEVSLVGEARYEGERFDGFDADSRLGAGLNWRVSNRGIVRGLAAVGLSDGAPDLQIRLGYAFDF